MTNSRYRILENKSEIVLEYGGKDFQPRIPWLCLSIFLMIVAWVLYLQQSTQATLWILPIHYLGLWLFSHEMTFYSRTTHAIAGFLIYIMDVLLDIFLYNTIHGLSLSPFYYISINFVHVLWYFVVSPVSKKDSWNVSLQILLFLAAFFFWVFGLWYLCLPVAIFSILRTYFGFDYKFSITMMIVLGSVVLVFLPLVFGVSIAGT